LRLTVCLVAAAVTANVCVGVYVFCIAVLGW